MDLNYNHDYQIWMPDYVCYQWVLFWFTTEIEEHSTTEKERKSCKY